ncbi:MAG: hypothetical protein AABW54_01360 [Candidatus Micrarchaeota archaeon]
MKTTVDLRDDVYYYIVSQFGNRNISKTINALLVGELFGKRDKSMFGAAKWLRNASWKDVRDESDRHF